MKKMTDCCCPAKDQVESEGKDKTISFLTFEHRGKLKLQSDCLKISLEVMLN